MLLPFLAALPAEIDASANVVPTVSAVVAASGPSHYMMTLAAADAAVWTRIRQPRTAFVLDASAHYGRALLVTGTTNPPQDLSARIRGRFDVVSSPLSNLVFSADGFIASRIGLRASDELIVRDPFSANRVLDGWSAQASAALRWSPRTSFRIDAGYAQMGAVAADVPAAVGVDTHTVTVSAGASYQWTRRLAIGPVLRFGWTHFNHALLDVNFTRGPAEVTSFSMLGSARYDISPLTTASLMAGLTLASAPPQAPDMNAVASPDVRFEVRTLGRQIGGSAGFSFGYQTVGPRIGFGMNYAGAIDGWARPFPGANRRDVVVHFVARTRWANALLAMDAASANNAAASANTGTLTTTAFAVGSSLSAPIRLGWSLSGGIDVEFVSTHMDPLPSHGDPPPAFRALFTLGLVAATSTNPWRLLPRDPLVPPDDGRMAEPRRALRRSVSTKSSEAADDASEEEDE